MQINVTHFLSKYFIHLFLHHFIHLFFPIFRGEGREKGRERNIDVWLPLARPLLGTWPEQNPGLCPDWESNWHQPFGSQAGTQSTEKHQPELMLHIFK